MGNAIACEQCGRAYEPSKLLRKQCPACLFSQALPVGDISTQGYAARFVPPKIKELAPLFPQLKIVELAGFGGMSAVYKAIQTNLGRTVAVKILPQEIAASQGGLERFQREALTLAQLNHPNIVQVYDAGQAGPWCYILMEYIPGLNLRQLLGESQLPSAQVLRITSAICDALQYAHDQGVVHRDIKPENVLVDREGQVKLVDFGLAKLLNMPAGDPTMSRTGQILGTPHYLAPEQMEAPGSVDHRADLYSLGVMMYEMLTGELPIGHFLPPSRKIGSDPALDATVLQAMARDRQQRYQQARELKDRLPTNNKGIPSPPMDQTLQQPRIQYFRMAQELVLSGSSLLAAFVGMVALVNAADGYWRRVQLDAQPILPLPLLTSLGLLGILLSYIFARLSVASRSTWQEISGTQYLALPSLIAIYGFFGFVLLAGPGIAVVLLGSLPYFADLESWSLFGKAFTEVDRRSLLTPYWFRVGGISLLVFSSWSILIWRGLRWRPELVQGLFHPASENTSLLISRGVSLIAMAICVPVGFVLLLASWLAR